MVYDIALVAGVVLLIIGLIHRIDAWFLRDVGKGERDLPVRARFGSAVKGLLGTVFSLRIFGVLKVFVVDVLLQGRILRDAKDPLAWPMHFCIFVGFTFLLLFHALGSIITTAIDPSYMSTLNPFMFLRNLFGFVLILGLVLAIVRRVVWRDRIRTTRQDVLALGFLVVIALSGVMLEGLKITSYNAFTGMVTDFGVDLSVEDIRSLQVYWEEHYGLVSPIERPAHDPAIHAHGEAVNADSCLMCHSQPQSAFVSYSASRLITPIAATLDEIGFVTVLWYVHVLSCCFGLAYLAFGKMFHIFGTPVSLFVAEAADEQQEPAAVANRQVIELDGCTHGGACHENCQVRKRRLKRMGEVAAFEPMLHYLEEKSAGDLGSRDVSG
jgi:nitrate reductase gamma subunit